MLIDKIEELKKIKDTIDDTFKERITKYLKTQKNKKEEQYKEELETAGLLSIVDSIMEHMKKEKITTVLFTSNVIIKHGPVVACELKDDVLYFEVDGEQKNSLALNDISILESFDLIAETVKSLNI